MCVCARVVPVCERGAGVAPVAAEVVSARASSIMAPPRRCTRSYNCSEPKTQVAPLQSFTRVSSQTAASAAATPLSAAQPLIKANRDLCDVVSSRLNV